MNSEAIVRNSDTRIILFMSFLQLNVPLLGSCRQPSRNSARCKSGKSRNGSLRFSTHSSQLLTWRAGLLFSVTLRPIAYSSMPAPAQAEVCMRMNCQLLARNLGPGQPAVPDRKGLLGVGRVVGLYLGVRVIAKCREIAVVAVTDRGPVAPHSDRVLAMVISVRMVMYVRERKRRRGNGDSSDERGNHKIVSH